MRCGCGPHVGSDGRSPVCVRDCPAVAVRTGASGFAQCVGAAEPHLQSECRGIRAGDGERFVREVGAEELRFGQEPFQGQCDAAASGADVEDAAGLRRGLRDPERQLLGFGAGDQHPFAHADPQAAELRVPHDVLQGASGGELGGDRSEPCDGDRSPRVGQQDGGGDARQLRDDREGDLACFALAVECEERVGDAADGLSAGAGCGRYVRVVHFRL